MWRRPWVVPCMKKVRRVSGVCLGFSLLLSVASAQPSTSNLTEISANWRIISADQVQGEDAAVSTPSFDASHWYAVQHMPATVLEILEEDGVYKDLYYGMNLTSPGDLWKKDWWYRTTFSVPTRRENYSLILKGINYRADVWLNGQKVADKSQVVGMYNSFEFDVSKLIHPGEENILALKITPERAIPRLQQEGEAFRVEGLVERGDTWLDWLNWK